MYVNEKQKTQKFGSCVNTLTAPENTDTMGYHLHTVRGKFW